MTSWYFEGDYFTACNCDRGFPCNFNAQPNDGRCIGWSVWQIRKGQFGRTNLAGARFAVYYDFPGPIELGNGTGCAYIDSRASAEQQEALETIANGKAGGRIRIGDHAEADSELLSYPDGSTIRPSLELPHGIEYKMGLMTNTRRWRWRDGRLSADYENRYGALASVKFTAEGCVG